MKRMLSIALVIVLGLALFIPTMAAETEETNPNAPIITRQPSAPSLILAGNSLLLEVQAELPEGVEGELSFSWYMTALFIYPELVGTDAQVEIPASVFIQYTVDVQLFPRGGFNFYVVVTNTFADEYGQEQTASVTSNEVRLNAAPRTHHIFLALWNLLGPVWRWFLMPLWIPIATLIAIMFFPVNLRARLFNLFN